MSIERGRAYFRSLEMEERVWEFDTSSATVELAAETLGVEPARIAKTLSFKVGEGCILVVAAGDARVDNRKFKERFGVKAKMLAFDEVEPMTGSAVGGVCPFALPKPAPVFLDVSLKRFHTVFPACGSDNSAIELSCDELFQASRAEAWVDVTKDWDETPDFPFDEKPNADLAPLDDGEIRIRVVSAKPADVRTGFVPMYTFDIERVSDHAAIGVADLRLGYVRNTYYGGNVGYEIHEAYRGHHYAEKAVRLVFEVARAHRMPYVLISCAETNLASKRTLERLGGALVETRIPPSYTGLYREGQHEPECIFQFTL